ncbi:phosphatidylglycerophosphatase A [Desulfosarcina ovata]|uniref:Phosphatidylglycerophosphatase A n=1 Tax=Desulfosarcina ovata subsp. ovata TaxID=2752305 RepID=A0A5K8A2W0_9BACT|nr:phosphatidylglycerophosphatase A [Desulfosarcina ovata]BBO86893.1 phosphatidylglycerophosphatase A [Desulfosarcina ovata subsp. ovata]
MKSFKDKAILFMATGGWVGYAPVAPGTFGSIAALPLCLLLASVDIGVAVALVIGLIVLSVWTAHMAAMRMGQSDPKQVVIDEICGMAVALLGHPFSPLCVLAGFALFRGFDILKPFPIRWVDRNVPGGWGIVLDDLIAGVCANALLHMGIFLLN